MKTTNYILEDSRNNVIIKSNNVQECIRFAKEEIEEDNSLTFFISKCTSEIEFVIDFDGVRSY